MLDNELNNRIKQYNKALVTLNEVINNDDGSYVYQDSILTRFEYCIELARKLGKKILTEEGFEDIKGPKSILKKIYELKRIKTIDIRIDFLERRNILSHTYQEKIAGNAHKYVKENYKVLYEFSESLKNAK